MNNDAPQKKTREEVMRNERIEEEIIKDIKDIPTTKEMVNSLERNKNYREKTGCHNCKHVFIYSDYDSGIIPYCNKSNDRPVCGNSDERFKESSPLTGARDLLNDELYMKQVNEWQEWSSRHQVSLFGICDLWKDIKKGPG